MPCNSPLKGYRGKGGKLVLKKADSWGQPMEVACGSCRGCRIDRSRAWAVRCVHEAQLHKHNSVITLTYNEQSLPKDKSLKLRHFQNFMKELRADIAPIRIRNFHCGEYGEKFSRPHYHALIFGYDFPDKYFWGKTKSGNNQYRSPQLERLWRKGNSTIGDMSWESAAYCARYVLKKINGDQAEDHYQYVDPETGECWEVDPEYTTQSNRPGIGHDWFQKNWRDIYPKDYCHVQTGDKLRKFAPPRYYDKLLKEIRPDIYEHVVEQRQLRAAEKAEENTPERQRTREEVLELRLKNQLHREYEK